jgi:mediator of RNA polymerase II transcription subunit 7
MAEDQQQPLAAAFPAPPPYYKNFTKKNIERLKSLQVSADADTNVDAVENQIRKDLPAELQCLVPPDPPADGKLRFFGEEVDVR